MAFISQNITKNSKNIKKNLKNIFFILTTAVIYIKFATCYNGNNFMWLI